MAGKACLLANIVRIVARHTDTAGVFFVFGIIETLLAGQTTKVYCLFVVADWGDWSHIDKVVCFNTWV
jgi:hypothetical protein